MTYIAKESGVLTGEPIELYEFVFPDTTYRYTTSINEYSALANVWSPAPIKRGVIKADNRKGVASIAITVPKDFVPSVLFKDHTRVRIPIRIYRTHAGDSEVILYGQWFIADVSFTDTNSIIRGASIAAVLQTELPRFYYQFQCNHEVYSSECGVIPTFLTGTVVTIDANDNRFITLSINAPAETLLGVITFGTERRLVIVADGSSTIKILEPFEFLTVGDSFEMHDKGCDRSYNTCTTVFSNGNRFGGMPFIPTRNVFDGGF